MPKASTKKSKVLWNSCGCFFQRQLSQPFAVSGELQASRLPRHPWLKIPRQILTLQNKIKPPLLSNFYHLSPMGTVPQAIHHVILKRSDALRAQRILCRLQIYHQRSDILLRQITPARNRPKRVVPLFVSVGSSRIFAAHDRDGTRRRGQLALCHRPRLPLHRLDTHFCGRLCNRHIWRRRWLLAIAQGNDNGNRRR